MAKCKFYLKSPNGSGNRCLNSSCRLKKCWFTDSQNECECFEPERIEYESSDAYEDEVQAAKAARQRSPMKLELIQFPYTKAGPTVCLEGWAIAGPNPFGVGKTLWEYEIKDSDIDRIEKLIHVYKKQKGE